jgi:hypothetical protein
MTDAIETASPVQQTRAADIIPGQREPGPLTRFDAPATSVRAVPLAPSTMDAATIAERQREGGGAPSERRPVGHRSRWAIVKGALAAMWPLQPRPQPGEIAAPTPAVTVSPPVSP